MRTEQHLQITKPGSLFVFHVHEVHRVLMFFLFVDLDRLSNMHLWLLFRLLYLKDKLFFYQVFTSYSLF